jgi:hypothetical protein
MKVSDILASIGVGVLLIGFLLNLFNKIKADGKLYAWLNFLGAAMCCYASFLIRFYPFIVLEAIWAFVALISLINVPRGTSANDN